MQRVCPLQTRPADTDVAVLLSSGPISLTPALAVNDDRPICKGLFVPQLDSLIVFYFFCEQAAPGKSKKLLFEFPKVALVCFSLYSCQRFWIAHKVKPTSGPAICSQVTASFIEAPSGPILCLWKDFLFLPNTTAAHFTDQHSLNQTTVRIQWNELVNWKKKPLSVTV